MREHYSFLKDILKGQEYDINKEFVINWKDLNGVFKAQKMAIATTSFPGRLSITFYGTVNNNGAIYSFQIDSKDIDINNLDNIKKYDEIIVMPI